MGDVGTVVVGGAAVVSVARVGEAFHGKFLRLL